MENYSPIDFNPTSVDNEFLGNLRTALQQSYDSGVEALENQRKLDQTDIMSNANRAGMLYSNFPQRDKIRYDTGTYMPNLVKLRNTYQTGLDSLRNAGVNAANQVAYYQQMIDHYNTLPTTSTDNSTSSLNQIVNALQGNTSNSNNTSSSSTSSNSNLLNTSSSVVQQVLNGVKVF